VSLVVGGASGTRTVMRVSGGNTFVRTGRTRPPVRDCVIMNDRH